MLAADITDDLDKLRFPCYVTPKLDGIRALIFLDGVRSRSLKLIPHAITQGAFREPELVGVDGELIVGDPTAPDVYRRTQSVVSTKDHPDIAKLYVFDLWDTLGADKLGPAYYTRLDRLRERVFDAGNQHVVVVPSFECADLFEGYEGVILRAPLCAYKHGRSTIKEQGMLKLKRFVDGEAEVIDIEEEMHNANEAKTNALGRTERSSHKANLVGKGTMGALVVRDVSTNVQFKIGTGFTAADRAREWKLGTIVKYKHFAHGAKDKPRHPKYVGLRQEFDL
jgi:DNA ligase-1